MEEKTKLLAWDFTLLLGIMLCIFMQHSGHNVLIVGLVTGRILSICVQKHIAAYKLNGKLY